LFLEDLPASSERPVRDPEDYLPMQKVTRQIAFDPSSWDEERKKKVAELFDSLAPEWHTRGGPERLRPTKDALFRGGVPGGGRALEIGSGTGIQTGVLLEHFEEVVSVDLSAEMLALAPRRDRVGLLRGDASCLPVANGSLEAVVCVNAYLFPGEYARVLKRPGRVVFVSTSGDQTPIYLPPEEVVSALEPFLGPLEATSARCGWGTWAVVASTA
jgi:ubiquinone/menaquinone biosynthesis C-methylase UbiE